MSPLIWNFDPNNKHDWAFFYYCKRQGDHVELHKGKRELHVWRAGHELEV